MLGVLLSNSLLVAAIWAGMYCFDYASTLWFARFYRNTLSNYIVYEGGVELNPAFEKDIARGRKLSPRFILALGAYFLAILAMKLLGDWTFEFVTGVLLLTWAFVDLRHLRNFGLQWLLRNRPDSLKGKLEYSYWYSQRMLSLDALLSGLLYGLLALLTARPFFMGGAFTCSVLAVRHFLLANRNLPKAEMPGG